MISAAKRGCASGSSAGIATRCERSEAVRGKVSRPALPRIAFVAPRNGVLRPFNGEGRRLAKAQTLYAASPPSAFKSASAIAAHSSSSEVRQTGLRARRYQ